MTLELLRYPDDFFAANRNPKPYTLGGVKKITCNTEYGVGHFAITIFDTRVFMTELYKYVKNAETGEYYVKDGVWVKEPEVELGFKYCPNCGARMDGVKNDDN